MSGFQIPGLGQAKPNETLPPLPPDLVAAAASAAGHEDLPDAPETQTAGNPTTEASAPAPAPAATDADAMAVDEQPPASPPSLTGALEAAIGGLASQPTQQPPAEEQQAPTTEQEASTQEQQVHQQTEQAALQSVDLQNDTGENPEWEIDSSPYESSESSSDSSSDSDDSDNEGYEMLGVEETARMLMEAGSDDEGGGPSGGAKSGAAAQLRTKNELADEPVIARPDVVITEDMPLEVLGAIEHIVDTTALVAGVTPGEYQVLDSGSVLCTASRVVVGAVAETIGKVTRPMYTVRFNSADEIAELGLAVGTDLYYTPAHATFVFTAPLKAVKGSDASNLYDEEAAADEVEFSDDEKEAEHKRAAKQKKKDKWKANNPEKAAAAAAARTKDHPLRQQHNVDAGLNYDDDEDGPYKPLARPSSLASGPGASQYDQPPSSSRHGGGRRGGDFRGRGRGGGRGSGSRGGYARGGGGGSSSSRDGYSLPPQGNQQPPNHYAPPPPQSVPQGAFGVQFPGWPPAAAPPPPPPGWPGSVAAAAPPPLPSAGQGGSGFNIDPAMIAAIMGQIQAQAANNGGQQPPAWNGQQPPGR
ncbi:NAF1 domain-containing protein [Beauveria bassiana ARSEF 2860]|uniref:H/ACA ribonucleoprotein complex non-core subunit NAF1 n=1 Tax=Beauveria bassiana (strain ARSEF 2860) TaxID=655819 RepID=J5JT12_BEAB2|nr:NAF1 domain-containing protein [Beauveria bassiana ARSEF 2860]EJP68028.1 NAF1 domain-containing protein [Beauveria bassiana ARSEF 2860]